MLPAVHQGPMLDPFPSQEGRRETLVLASQIR